MVYVALALLMAITGESDIQNIDYETAFSRAQKEEKPLLVLVGAKWCAACQILKRDTIVPMNNDGELKEVVVTYVDMDDRPELAEKLMRGESLPQIVLFSKRSGAWKKFSLTGVQSRSRMTELLNRASNVAGKRIGEKILR